MSQELTHEQSALTHKEHNVCLGLISHTEIINTINTSPANYSRFMFVHQHTALCKPFQYLCVLYRETSSMPGPSA